MVLRFLLVVVVGILPLAVAEFEVTGRTREEWVDDFSVFGEHLQDRVKRGCPLSLASDFQVRGRCYRSRATSFSWFR